MQQPAAPITHGSRIDHIYAIDAPNGLTYVGHCDQIPSATGLLNLTRYRVIAGSEIRERMKVQTKDYPTVVTEMYLEGHTKMATVVLTAEGRIAIHSLDEMLRHLSPAKQSAPVAAPAPAPGSAPAAG